MTCKAYMIYFFMFMNILSILLIDMFLQYIFHFLMILLLFNIVIVNVILIIIY